MTCFMSVNIWMERNLFVMLECLHYTLVRPLYGTDIIEPQQIPKYYTIIYDSSIECYTKHIA